MKTYTLLSCLLITILLVANTRCNKHPINTAPVADAGSDFLIWRPAIGAQLNGSYSDIENNIKEISWAKTSGPNSYVLENKNSLETQLRGLEKGVYQFELTVTDDMNLFDKDIVVVTIEEMRDNPTDIIFKDLVWIFPWYNNVVIDNFVRNIPPGTMFKIFIQRDNDPAWKEVPPETSSGSFNGLYEYFVIPPYTNSLYTQGSLYISYYGTDVDDTPNVKIVF